VDNPWITIITVVYNGEACLESTIQSVFELQYCNLSYIVIDGNSTDGTVDIINKYNDVISYWVSENDSGIYDAMNKGWACARDDSFILFLGAGDKVVSLPDNMNNYSVNDVVFGRVMLGDKLIFKPVVDYKLKISNTVHHQAMLVHKSLTRDNPFNLEYKFYSDFDFNQRLLKSGARFVYSDSFVGYALPGGVTSKFYYRENFAIVLKNYGLFWALVSLGFVPLVKLYKKLTK
jgi:glycosyltransferase involved in cell wall biosynthesis